MLCDIRPIRLDSKKKNEDVWKNQTLGRRLREKKRLGEWEEQRVKERNGRENGNFDVENKLFICKEKNVN